MADAVEQVEQVETPAEVTQETKPEEVQEPEVVTKEETPTEEVKEPEVEIVEPEVEKKEDIEPKDEKPEPKDESKKEIETIKGQLKKEQGKVATLKNQVESLEVVVKSMLESKLNDIPEEYKGLVPDGDIVSQLAWINKAEQSGIFKSVAKVNPNIEIGKPLEMADKKAKGTSELNPQQALSNYFSNYFYKK